MENIHFDRPNDNYDLTNRTPQFSTSGSPQASSGPPQAVPAVDQLDEPSGEQALPLLRLGNWESDKQYDKKNPTCIHYDFQWKISQRENIRARHLFR